jgi:tetratricopeptide (TPR) repeat protein
MDISVNSYAKRTVLIHNLCGRVILPFVILLLSCLPAVSQEPEEGGRPSRGPRSANGGNRLETSLDYQELRLLRDKKLNDELARQKLKDTDVEDLLVPQKALDEIGKARRSLKAKKPEAALEHLKKAAAIYPRYSKTYNNMGIIYRDLGRLAEAEGALSAAVEINPKNKAAQMNLGLLYLSLNRALSALQPLSAALQLDPSDSSAATFLGDAMFRVGRLDDAEVTLKKALAVKPDSYAAKYRLGCVYARKGKYQEAIPLLQDVLRRDHPGIDTSAIESLLSRLKELAPGMF